MRLYCSSKFDSTRFDTPVNIEEMSRSIVGVLVEYLNNLLGYMPAAQNI